MFYSLFVATVFPRYLSCHHFFFGRDQSLTNFPRLLVTFLIGNLNRPGHWDVLTLLHGNVDTLLALHLQTGKRVEP